MRELPRNVLPTARTLRASRYENMRTTRNIGIAVTAVAVMLAGAGQLRAAPPATLTVGGTVQQATDGTGPGGAVWRVHIAGDSGQQAGGTVGDLLPTLWAGDMGAISSSLEVGTDCVSVISRELGSGTLAHTGYYAVVNHVLTGNDPAEFPNMTLRQIPIPAVTSAVLAHLTWDAASEDPGDAGKTNLMGYTVSRSADGIGFTLVSTSLVTVTQFDDAIPNDTEYYYAIGLVFRGDPPVTGAVLSANSIRTFKDTDSDTLPDYFELANGLDETSGVGTNGPAGDADGDTMSNMEELIAGTLANDKDSYFFVKSVAPDGDGFTIQWDGVADRWYSLYRSSHLASNDWSRIYGPTYCPTDQAMEHTDSPGGSAPRFYRLKVSRD